MIKVGDWVKCEGKIGKVVHVYLRENTAWVGVMFSVGCMDDVQKYLLTKLPIKFKGFNVVLDYAGNWVCYRHTKILGKIHVVCIKKGSQFFTGFHVSHGMMVSRYFPTIEQAKNWLELQYATILAKARGLV